MYCGALTHTQHALARQYLQHDACSALPSMCMYKYTRITTHFFPNLHQETHARSHVRHIKLMPGSIKSFIMHTCFDRSRLSSASSSFASLSVISRFALPIRTSSCCSSKHQHVLIKFHSKVVSQAKLPTTENHTGYDVWWRENRALMQKKVRCLAR